VTSPNISIPNPEFYIYTSSTVGNVIFETKTRGADPALQADQPQLIAGSSEEEPSVVDGLGTQARFMNPRVVF